MTKKKLLLSVLSAGVAIGALIFLFSRRAQRATRPLPSVRASKELLDEAAGQHSALSPPGLAIAEPVLHVVVSGSATDGQPTPTVQCSLKMPTPIGADDIEALEPEEIGSDWLSRATQSERSLSEADLEVDLENIAQVLDDAEPMSEDFSETEG